MAKNVVESGVLSQFLGAWHEDFYGGTKVKEFEKKWSKWLGVKYSVFVNSGSSACLLAIASLDLEPGSEIITPALTFSTTVGCIAKNDLIPVFVDVEPYTYCIDATKIEESITEKTVAILINGLSCNVY